MRQQTRCCVLYYLAACDWYTMRVSNNNTPDSTSVEPLSRLTTSRLVSAQCNGLWHNGTPAVSTHEQVLLCNNCVPGIKTSRSANFRAIYGANLWSASRWARSSHGYYTPVQSAAFTKGRNAEFQLSYKPPMIRRDSCFDGIVTNIIIISSSSSSKRHLPSWILSIERTRSSSC